MKIKRTAVSGFLTWGLESTCSQGSATHQETAGVSIPHTPEHLDPRTLTRNLGKSYPKPRETHDTPLEIPILLKDFGEDKQMNQPLKTC